jgi:hypothetical protein
MGLPLWSALHRWRRRRTYQHDVGWPSPVDWPVMNPDFLVLALRTPLEQLLLLPNGIRIALWAKEELTRFNDDQLRELLAWIDATITQSVMLARSDVGDAVIDRADERDLDWLMQAHDHSATHALPGGTPFGFRDYYRVLALYKLGVVIDAVGDLPPVGLSIPVAAALMEAQEAVLLADVLPDVESVEAVIERAWREGMTPPSVVDAEIAKAISQTSRTLNDVLHAPNREAKRKGIDLYFSNTYDTDEQAYRVIAMQVCRSAGTVRNWILEEKQRRKRNQ